MLEFDPEEEKSFPQKETTEKIIGRLSRFTVTSDMVFWNESTNARCRLSWRDKGSKWKSSGD